MLQTSINTTQKYSQEMHYNYVGNSGFGCCTFTGKERDSETGFSYFGARYYDSDLMTGWLSVDPLADKYPNISPYAYCAWNPVKLVDPDGEDVWEFNESTGVLSLISNKGGSKEQTVNFTIEKNSKKTMTKSVYYQGQIQDMFDFSFISNKADKIIEGGLKIFGGMTSVVGGVFIGASGAGFLVGGTMFVYGATETVYGIKDIFDGINGNSIESKYEEHETIKSIFNASFNGIFENKISKEVLNKVSKKTSSKTGIISLGLDIGYDLVKLHQMYHPSLKDKLPYGAKVTKYNNRHIGVGLMKP